MTTTTAPDTPIDLVYGTRATAECATCHRTLPAEDQPVLEAAFDGDDNPICSTCLETVHPGLHAALYVLRVLARTAGTHDGKRIADDCLGAILTGIELLTEDTARPTRLTPRPIRHQPTRSTRRARRR